MDKKFEKLADAFWQMIDECNDDSKVISSFVELCKKRGVLARSDSILRAIENKALDIEHKQSVFVKTGFEASDSLENKIKNYFKSNKITFETDESVIGGVEILTHNRRISSTLADRLERFKHSFN